MLRRDGITMFKIRDFIRDEKGSTALEFAMLATPLLAGLFAIIEMSYKSIQQTELDSKLNAVAGQMALNNFTSSDANEYMRDEFCPDIGTNFLRCSSIDLGINVLTQRFFNYRNTSVIGTWNLGCSGDAIMIELNYPVTNAIHPFVIGDIVERGGTRYYRSRAVIRREPLLAGSGAC